ncbi:spheroidene monooxygenase [Roseinatronobacter thiooxidans]|uniref:Spheroidene monooxygenase n=1 Tax=Roseinatronobacter thiooxidans TaxID=121821 RepID=A0A2W7QNP3_9RHOB|nr:spheroidene monooxygenase [Roseinatronobacter thiooxidans]PZX45567.1 spheroidene monooxygenase [Roseinatronobacter thiooxidans]
MQTVTLSLFRFDRALTRFWVIGQMGAARFVLPRVDGLNFWKLCGSGTGEGFTPKPNWGTWAILAGWDSRAQADAGLQRAPFSQWRARADESMTLYLEPYSARGQWGGAQPFAPVGGPDGPIAAMTRATVKPARALRFWGRVPDISAKVGADPNIIFKIGIGEVPLLHQVTFSIWPDAETMAAFARRGPHAEAIRAVRDEGWFNEELYARFRITGSVGTWQGRDPLAATKTQEAA